MYAPWDENRSTSPATVLPTGCLPTNSMNGSGSLVLVAVVARLAAGSDAAFLVVLLSPCFLAGSFFAADFLVAAFLVVAFLAVRARAAGAALVEDFLDARVAR